MAVRERYLDHASIVEVITRWEREHPELVKLHVLGTTPEGREIWCVTIGREPHKTRPALLVDAGQHAVELAGTNVALAIGEAVIGLLSDPEGAPAFDLPRAAVRDLDDVLLHIVPRVSPDGAERVLRDGWTLRSVPRPPLASQPRWVARDLDVDGQIRLIRRCDPSGDLVESGVVPGLLVARQLGDEGPFYKAWPEGIIEGFDGMNVPTPAYLSDNYPDLNRNFPYDWRPEHEQVGAGDHPLSEPESRALAAFATQTPNLFGWIDYHTFGGVFIRPLGAGPDTKLDPADLALYRQLEVWAEALTGYPMVSGFEQFTYAPDTPLRGDLTEYAYHQRGTVAFVVELWDLFERVGLPKQKRFVDRYERVGREEIEKIALWAQEQGAPFLHAWRPLAHPQLGAVEVGGADRRFVIFNPPPTHLPELCDKQVAMALRLMACAPIVTLGEVEVTALGGGVHRVDLAVRNRGYLPTHVVAPGKNLLRTDPLTVVAEGIGCAVISPTGPVEIGSLDGWGRGLHVGSGLFTQSTGTTEVRRLRYVVEGAGTLSVRAGNRRMGHKTLEIGLPSA